MKKFKFCKSLPALIMMSIFFATFSVTAVYAGQATSYTYTLNSKGEYVRTQDAYLPDATITQLGLSDPEDLFVDDDNMLYILDTGNKRVIKYDIDNGSVYQIFTSEYFINPRGIFVTHDKDIYIADAGAKMILVFDKDFNLKQSFDKPDSPILQDTNFEPKRIGVDSGGNIYLVSEGVYNGIIQLAKTGEFLGYFTVNHTRLSLKQAFEKLIFTREQLANTEDINPTTFANIFVDTNGIVYTVTSGTEINGVKKHNTSGGNMFKGSVVTRDSLTDVYVDSQGLIYTSSYEGHIDVYSTNGDFIFAFGSGVTNLDVVGLFTSLPSIAVDKNGYIWAVDGTKGYVQSFKPTEYASKVYNAMNLYEEGLYDQAMEQWTDVLNLNQMSSLAHNGVGKAYFHAEDYKNAMVHFKVANNREYYSEAFWEVRNKWIQDYLGYILIGLILLFAAFKLIKFVTRNKQKAGNSIRQKLWTVPVLKDVLYAFKIPRHPIDRYYDIRVKKKGSIIGATILYLAFFVMFMVYKTCKGFIYQYTAVEDMDINAIVIGYFAIVALFVICNYLVTSINDGDGNFKQVYMIPAYGLVPAFVSMLAVTIISYVLTYNEAFLLTIMLIIGISWSVVSIFIGLQVVHDYTFKETVKSLVLTALFMIIIAIVSIIISIMWNSLYTFLYTIGKEVAQNVL